MQQETHNQVLAGKVSALFGIIAIIGAGFAGVVWLRRLMMPRQWDEIEIWSMAWYALGLSGAAVFFWAIAAIIFLLAKSLARQG